MSTGAWALKAEFAPLYAQVGRPSIPPEKLLRAMLLQAFYSIRSERQVIERLEYDLLFRWFVGLGVDDPAWDHSTFSKNCDRLLDGDIAVKFLSAVLVQPRVKRLLSTEHFSVDGTLIEAWASMKSFRPKECSDKPPSSAAQCGGELPGRDALQRDPCLDHRPRREALPQGAARRRSSASWARPDGEPLGPCGQRLPDPADGHAERVAALALIEPHADRPRSITLGTDKAIRRDFVNELRSISDAACCGTEPETLVH